MPGPGAAPPTDPSPAPPESLEALLRIVKSAVDSSPHLKEAIRQLGLWLVQMAEVGGSSVGEPAPATSPAATEAPSAAAAPVYQPRPIRGPTEVVISAEVAAAALARGLGAGGVSPRVAAPLAGAGESVTIPAATLDFNLLRARCRLKAEACAFAIRRDRHEREGGSFEALKAEYDDLVARAKQPSDCFLWMINPKWSIPDEGKLLRLERCYTNLGEAIALVQEHGEARGHGAWPAGALWLLAEAQSALYAATHEGPWLNVDPDQQAAWSFVRDEARRLHMYMDRYMSTETVADPDQYENLAFQIKAARAALQAERQSIKARREALKKVEYEARRLLDCDVDERAAHVRTIETAVTVFLRAGGEASAPALVELIEQVRQRLGETAGGLIGPGSILQSVQPAPARAASDDGEAGEGDDRQVGPELLRVRDLLHEKTVLFIGGEERPQHARKLQESLELHELRWVGHREHSSLAPLESEIARPEVDLVLLPIRWNGTESGPIIRNWCRQYNKPCVTLKAGYNANQIAHAVLEQVSERLAAAQ